MAIETVPPPVSPEALSQERRTRERLKVFGLVFPGLFWLTLFFAMPLVVIFIYSFLTPGPRGDVVWTFTFDNYARLFTESLFVNAYVRSIWLGILTTLICLLIGYPLAVFIAQAPPRWRTILLFMVLIPFWTNFLVRTYAWMIILQNNGLINWIVTSLGFPRLSLMNTQTAVLIGLVYGELPFMVLPLYASIDRFDFTLMQAASDLGASKFRAFVRVMLPLTMPGIAAGSVLVFIPTVGQFVVSDLLGGAKVDMLGNLLQRLFTRANPPNWPLGSALALMFMLVLMILIVFYFRSTTEDDR